MTSQILSDIPTVADRTCAVLDQAQNPAVYNYSGTHGNDKERSAAFTLGQIRTLGLVQLHERDRRVAGRRSSTTFFDIANRGLCKPDQSAYLGQSQPGSPEIADA